MEIGDAVVVDIPGIGNYFGRYEKTLDFDNFCEVQVHVEQDKRGKIKYLKQKDLYTHMTSRKYVKPMVVIGPLVTREDPPNMAGHLT